MTDRSGTPLVELCLLHHPERGTRVQPGHIHVLEHVYY